VVIMHPYMICSTRSQEMICSHTHMIYSLLTFDSLPKAAASVDRHLKTQISQYLISKLAVTLSAKQEDFLN